MSGYKVVCRGIGPVSWKSSVSSFGYLPFDAVHRIPTAFPVQTFTVFAFEQAKFHCNVYKEYTL